MHGKTDIIFIDPQKTKVNGEHYVGLLRDKLILQCDNVVDSILTTTAVRSTEQR